MPGGPSLGKKISVPKDVMMEELNLPSNRGSRMFQERQKRVERFTLENMANDAYNTNTVREERMHMATPVHTYMYTSTHNQDSYLMQM